MTRSTFFYQKIILSRKRIPRVLQNGKSYICDSLLKGITLLPLPTIQISILYKAARKIFSKTQIWSFYQPHLPFISYGIFRTKSIILQVALQLISPPLPISVCAQAVLSLVSAPELFMFSPTTGPQPMLLFLPRRLLLTIFPSKRLLIIYISVSKSLTQGNSPMPP